LESIVDAEVKNRGDGERLTESWFVTAPLLFVRDQRRRLHQAYAGKIVQWLDDEQREHFLRLGLVEQVADESAPVQPRPAPSEISVVNPEIVDEILADLDRLGVAADSGAPTCRKALRDAGISVGNDVVAAVVKQRRARAALSGTAS
jgi:cytochrome c oxidase cbb3-type subunit II